MICAPTTKAGVNALRAVFPVVAALDVERKAGTLATYSGLQALQFLWHWDVGVLPFATRFRRLLGILSTSFAIASRGLGLAVLVLQRLLKLPDFLFQLCTLSITTSLWLLRIGSTTTTTSLSLKEVCHDSLALHVHRNQLVKLW